MVSQYPDPQQLGIRIPTHLKEERFCSGFRHALDGGQLNKREFLRLSFREGYRVGKLYLREVRRKMGIIEFPMKAKVRMRILH